MSSNETSYKEENTQAIFVFILLPICFLIYGCCKTINKFYSSCINDDEDFISSSEYETESDPEELEEEENSTRELKPDYDSADSDESKYQ